MERPRQRLGTERVMFLVLNDGPILCKMRFRENHLFIPVFGSAHGTGLSVDDGQDYELNLL